MRVSTVSGSLRVTTTSGFLPFAMPSRRSARPARRAGRGRKCFVSSGPVNRPGGNSRASRRRCPPLSIRGPGQDKRAPRQTCAAREQAVIWAFDRERGDDRERLVASCWRDAGHGGRRRLRPSKPERQAVCRCRASSASNPTRSMCARARQGAGCRLGLRPRRAAGRDDRRIRELAQASATGKAPKAGSIIRCCPAGAPRWSHRSRRARTSCSRCAPSPTRPAPSRRSCSTACSAAVKKCRNGWCRADRRRFRRLDRADALVGRLSEREAGMKANAPHARASI